MFLSEFSLHFVTPKWKSTPPKKRQAKNSEARSEATMRVGLPYLAIQFIGLNSFSIGDIHN